MGGQTRNPFDDLLDEITEVRRNVAGGAPGAHRPDAPAGARRAGRALFVIKFISTGHFCRLAVGAIAIASVASLTTMDNFASAQTARTIRLVVPYAPGGVVDAMVRLFAEQIDRTQGRSAVVENRPGAGTAIATEAVSRAAPDGNTILLVANSFVINAHIRKLSYNSLSFEPICYLVESPTIYAVNAASAYRTLNDLLVAARAKPGELSMAGSGPATGYPIGFEILERAANIDMAFVPYGGTVPAVGALLGGHVTAAIGDYGVMAEYLRSGKLRALAAGSAARIEPLPDVPTVAESGFTGYAVGAWYGLVAPAKTPKETVSRLAEWFGTVMQSSEFRAKIVRLGLYPVGCDIDFRAHIRQQYDEYGRIIRDANIKAE
jgi:tripartite-type tricarboxylate transporter receptor subunit TctC